MTHLHHGGRRARLARPGHARRARNERPTGRSGALVIEAFVALTLLTTVLSVAVPLVVQHGRLLADCRSYRLALDELSNQLDRLSALPAEELAASLQQLRPSELTARSLPGAKLTSQLDSVDLGVRLTLRISWGEPQWPAPLLRAREGTTDRERIAFATGSEWHDAPWRASRRGATCHTVRNLSLVAWVFLTQPATIEPARPEEESP